MNPGRLATAAYLALLGWQPTWLLLLPPPAGPRSLWLALAATAPLLVPLKGVLEGRLRAMTWGGFLAVVYFVLGVTEAWSNPPMRPAAAFEAVLALAYVITLTSHVRHLRRG